MWAIWYAMSLQKSCPIMKSLMILVLLRLNIILFNSFNLKSFRHSLMLNSIMFLKVSFKIKNGHVIKNGSKQIGIKYQKVEYRSNHSRNAY